MRNLSRRAISPSRLLMAGVAVCGLALAGCDDNGGDPNKQIGANPVLPEPQQYLLPPMHIAKIAHWGEGEKPTVPQGLTIRALATGLQHPRSLYALPNGDVLVVEANGPKAPINRPKDLIMGWVQSLAGANAKGGNRITLLRGADGNAELQKSVFLDHLNSPFGVALIGQDLYVANTDAIIRYPYSEGQTAITAEGTKLTDLPGGRSTITGPRACWPVRTDRSSMSASDPTATSPKTAFRRNMNARRSGKWTSSRAPIASSPAACAIPPACNGSRRAENFGPSQTSATNSDRTWCRTI